MLQPVTVSELLDFIPGETRSKDMPNTLATGIAYDSRTVLPGNIFVAITGGSSDGHRYIPDAIRQGAVAIIGTQDLAGLPVPYLKTEDSRFALARLSAAFYGFPSKSLVVIGVTGTDGKTTTANLIYQILRAARIEAGMVSTVNAVIRDEIVDTGFHVTTPEAPEIQRLLARMVESGLSHVVLEATSHGLDQQRVAECYFDIGVVTNITHEHLDYHQTFEAYLAAKGRLFRGLESARLQKPDSPAAAVLNQDDRSYPYLADISPERQVAYGLSATADVWADNILSTSDGLSFDIFGLDDLPGGNPLSCNTNLIGEYNAYNCLAAAVTGKVLKLPGSIIQQGLANLSGVPGRMERIDFNREFPGMQNFLALVDFAHTPNSLINTLKSARQLANGRVIVVFGCAGLRDRVKRGLMAEAAAQLADLSIFTAEDPRAESVHEILNEMAVGAKLSSGVEGQTFIRIPDRREAIRLAVRMAQAGDLVLACGKGHEQSMCFGETEYAWDDRSAMRAALAERFGLPGHTMPFLPII